MPHASSRIDPKKAPASDPLGAKQLALGLALLAAVFAFRKWTVPALLIVAILFDYPALNFTTKYKRRAVLALILMWVCLGATNPFKPSWSKPFVGACITYVLLGIWVAWRVGRIELDPNANLEQREALRGIGWEHLRTALGAPEGTTRKKTKVNDKQTASVETLVLPDHVAKGADPKAMAAAWDRIHQLPPGSTAGSVDQANARLVHLRTRLVKPFDFLMPPPPAATDKWIPLGCDEDGEAEGLDIMNEDAQHLLVFGASGSGKSKFLRWIMLRWQSIGAKVIVHDPKRSKTFLGADYLTHDIDEAEATVQAVWEEMKRRQASGHDWWPGEWLVLILDEAASILKRTNVPRYLEEIVQQGRTAKVVAIVAPQAVRVGSTGGGETLANFVTRIGFRTMDEKEHRMGFGKTVDPYRTDLISPSTPGRCIVMGLRSRPWVELQCWLPTLPPPHASTRNDTPLVGMSVGAIETTLTQARQDQTDKTPDNVSDPADAILEALPDDGTMSIRAIVDATGVPKWTVEKTLPVLEQRGRVCRPRGPKGGYAKATAGS